MPKETMEITRNTKTGNNARELINSNLRFTTNISNNHNANISATIKNSSVHIAGTSKWDKNTTQKNKNKPDVRMLHHDQHNTKPSQ